MIEDAGGTTSSLFKFARQGFFCILDWLHNLKSLAEPYKNVSTHMMEWIRVWLNPELEDVKCHVYSPYMIQILKFLIELHFAENIEVFIEFLHEKYHTLPAFDITTLILS